MLQKLVANVPQATMPLTVEDNTYPGRPEHLNSAPKMPLGQVSASRKKEGWAQ